MKKVVLLLCLCFLVWRCETKPVEKPDNLISEDQMESILYDLAVINAIKTSGMMIANRAELTPSAYIYQKYKIDSLQFAQSDRFYATDIEEYENLYLRVTERLRVDKTRIDTLIARNPAEETLKIKNESNTEKNNTKDALLNKRATRSTLFLKKTEKNQ